MLTDAKEIPNYPNHLATPDGRIWSKKKKRFLSGTKHDGKYLAVWLVHGERKFVHALILETFVGPRPEGMITRHLNGNSFDNSLENLAWGTSKENSLDTVRHGRNTDLSPFQFGKGENHPHSKLKPLDVVFIKAYRKYKNYSLKKLAEMFNVGENAISKICKGLRWKHIPEP